MNLPEPITRKEIYLKAIAEGIREGLPEPITRKEIYLKAIAENSTPPEPVLDPNYTYHKYGSNDEIIVRVYHEGESDQHIWWFFRGWDQIADQMEVPSDLVPYVPNNPGHAWTTANYPEGGTTQNGWVGFINGHIGVWSTNWYYYLHGLTYGSLDASVMEPINTLGDVEQTNAYVDDPYIYL